MSLKKIAEMTGLSLSTISHALNDTRAVSESSKKAVLAAAGQIGYRPNMAARMLRTQKSQTIALLIPGDEQNFNANYFYMDVILGVRKKILESNYELIVSTYDMSRSGERSFNSIELLKRQWIDGIIVVPFSENKKHIKALQELETPFVLLDRRTDDYEYSCVDSDNEKGACDAVNLFGTCGKKKIGFIGGNSNNSTGRQRLNGYKLGLERLGMQYDERYVRITNTYSLENGKKCAEELVNSGVDAIFAADNVMMMGALRYLSEQKIQIPKQVGIIGFDDFEWMAMANPPITTVKQQAYQMGYIASEMLLRKLNGMDFNEKIVLSTSLVIRKSHG